MERAVAVKALTKILGKSLGYRVDLKAPDTDTRAEAKAALHIAIEARNKIKQLKDERYRTILAADKQYQELSKQYKDEQEAVEKLASISRHYKFTVGTTDGMFFSVRAEGDSWEEVIAKLSNGKA
jgi:hypothetical protein